MKFSEYKLQASNFVVVFKDVVWDKLTSEKIKEALLIKPGSDESVDLVENSDLNVRILTFKKKGKRLTIETNRLIIDQLSDFGSFDKDFYLKLSGLFLELKPHAIGFNFEVKIILTEKIGWQEFFSLRVVNFLDQQKEEKNFGFKFQIAQEKDHSWIMNIATAIKDDGNLYMRFNSHYDNIKEINQDIINSKWASSLEQLNFILTNI